MYQDCFPEVVQIGTYITHFIIMMQSPNPATKFQKAQRPQCWGSNSESDKDRELWEGLEETREGNSPASLEFTLRLMTLLGIVGFPSAPQQADLLFKIISFLFTFLYLLSKIIYITN